MSGKRQHFIPRFLQDGFASHRIMDEAYTWVYRKGKPPFNTNIINVGVEGHFYTGENDTLLDDIITEAEGPFSNLIETLKKSSPGNISDARLPELIAHLEVRTRHIRQNFLQSFDYFCSRMISFIADEEAFTNYLKRRFQKDPSMIHERMAKEFAKRGIPRQKAKAMIRNSKPLIPLSIEQLKPMFSKIAAELRSTLPSQLRDVAKESHIRALKSDVAPESRIQRYKNLTYTMSEILEGNLILGDSIILFHVEGPKTFKSILTNDKDVIKSLYLPISPHRVLIGAPDLTCVQQVNLRQAVSRCSLEFFIAHTNSNENNVIREQIGEDADIFSKEEIEKTIDELIKQ